MRRVIIFLVAFLLGLLATLATAGTPDRSAWKKAWYRARQSGYQFPTNGLVSYWSMDSVSGTTVYDTFSTNNLTLNGDVSISADTGINEDSALAGDGSNDKKMQSEISLNRDSFSVSLWVKPTYLRYTHNYQVLMDEYRNTQAYYFGINYDGIRFSSFNHIGTRTNLEFPSGFVSSGIWYHICITFDDTQDELCVYVDGVLLGKDTIISIRISPDTLWFMQSRDAAWRYQGYMDEIGVWDRVLSSNEVHRIGNTNNPVFYEP